MSLQQEIETMQQEFLKKIPPEVMAVMQHAMKELTVAKVGKDALGVGDNIVPFDLPNSQGVPVSSFDLLRRGPLVVSFYRGGWCPYCSLELRAYQKIAAEIKSLGANLVAIAPETIERSTETAKNNELSFETLSDQGNHVARDFGLVFSLPEVLRPVYQNFGIDLVRFNGDENYELPIPATYVILPSGKIVEAFVELDYTNRIEPTEILEKLKMVT